MPVRCFCCKQEHETNPTPPIPWESPIPRLIHHLWLTDAVPTELLAACRKSFEDRHPGWSFAIHRNCDVFDHPVLAEYRKGLHGAYRFFGTLKGGNLSHTPWGSQADLLRLAVLYVYGGFYVDHDLYCLRPLDRFRNDDLVLVNCLDEPLNVTEAVIGCRPGDPRIVAILEEFLRCPVLGDVVCPRLTCWVHSYGWKTYPAEYFCPHDRRESSDEAKYRVTPSTHAVHCWKQNTYDLERLRSLVP